MDKVQKAINSECCTPSSDPLGSTSTLAFRRTSHEAFDQTEGRIFTFSEKKKSPFMKHFGRKICIHGLAYLVGKFSHMKKTGN
jgi:hypothetical protein